MANQLSRQGKSDRAFRLLAAGSGSGVAAVVLLFVSGIGLCVLFALIAVACFYGFRRTVGS